MAAAIVGQADTMAAAIVGQAEKLWEDWNIRVCILLSFVIQCCLTFLAPWRKRNKNTSFFIWILYLLADAIALYTIGLISNSSSSTITEAILVFWSPFLLLHLGGPDTITALALEDNELWLRHLLQLGTQSAGTIYLFYRSFQNKFGAELLFPSVIMYISGCVKYLERTSSLYFASMDTYRESLIGKPNAGPNYAALMEEYASRKAANIPVQIKSNLETAQSSSSSRSSRGNQSSSHHTVAHDLSSSHGSRTGSISSHQTVAHGSISSQTSRTTAGLSRQTSAHGSSRSPTLQTQGSSQQTGAGDCEQGCIEQIEDMNLVKEAHDFYLKFRGLIADTMFSFKERTESRQFFLDKQKKQISGVQAFKMIQIELNFIYDVFFTKMHTLQRARGITRIFSIGSIVAAFLLFFFRHSHKYSQRDLYITYVLLGGAVTMEVIAIIMLSFSDWAVVVAVDSAKRRCKAPFSTILLKFWLKHRPRRWSEEVSQYDLLYYCLNDQSTLVNLLLFQSFKDVAENFLYVSRHDFDEELGNLIYAELKRIAEAADEPKNTKKACEARGNLVFDEEFATLSKGLHAWTVDVDYDESLLLWHIATNLCVLESVRRNDDNKGSPLSKSCLDFRKYSKMIGNYMMYLLIMKPSMTSSVAGIAQVRFQDTCEEAKKFIRRKLPREEVGRLAKVIQFFKFLGRMILLSLCAVKNLALYCCCWNKASEDREEKKLKLDDKRLRSLCRRILDVNTEKKPVEVKGDRSQSVMFDACRLAKELIKIGQRDGEETQWKVTFKVWVELLCYAASRSKPTAHVAQLREGGELITIVWLLMAHLGLGEQFRINKGTGWAKLIVRK